MKVFAPLFAFFVLASAQNLFISSPTKGQLVNEGSELLQVVRVGTDVCFVSLFSQLLVVLKLTNLLYTFTGELEHKTKRHNHHRYHLLPSIRRMPRSIYS